MTKPLVVAMLAILAAVPARAFAGKLYAVSAQYEPSNAVLYRYEVTGPDDHRYEANPPGEVDEPELTLPIGQWPDNSPVALALSPWHEMFVFDRGPSGNGFSAGSVFRFLDPAGPAPVPNGRIVSSPPEFSFGTPHFGAFRGDELFVAQRYSVVERFLVDPAGPVTYNGQLQVSGGDSPRGVQVTPWGEVFVAQLGYPPILRYRIADDGSAVPNGSISGCGVSNPHDMVFSPWGELFVAAGATSQIARITFDESRNASCAGTIDDPSLYSAIGISIAPWGELFVSTHMRNEIVRWLVGPDGAAAYNGTIFTPIGPVVSWVGTVRGLGDVEFVGRQRETVTVFSGDPSFSYVDPSGYEKDHGTPCTHRTSYPLWSVQGDWVTEPSYLIPTYTPYWNAIPGTSWINWHPSMVSPGMSYDYEGNFASYEASFYLPASAANTSVNIQYMGDDWVDVYLNGVQIVDQHSIAIGLVPTPPDFCTYHCLEVGLPIPSVVVSDPARFVPGRNTIRFVQRDPDGAGGLDYLATVTYDRDAGDREVVPPFTRATVSGTRGQGGWFTSPVTVTLSAADAGSGVATTEVSLDGTTWAAYADPFELAATGAATFWYRATDRAGNVEDARSATVNVDATAPSVSISAPSAGAAYVLGQPVLAAWAATDAGSGLASATGTVESGAPIDTATVGAKPFAVTAADLAGNSAAAAADYAVRYAFGGILPPLRADGTTTVRVGTSVGVKFQLFDWARAVVPGAVASLFVAPVVNGAPGAEVPATSQSGSAGNLFRFDPLMAQYVFNWSTRGLAAGVWRLRIQLDDGTSQLVTLKLVR